MRSFQSSKLPGLPTPTSKSRYCQFPRCWQKETLHTLARIDAATQGKIAVQEKYLEIIGALELDKTGVGCGLRGLRDMLPASPATRRHFLLALFATHLQLVIEMG